MQEIVYRNQPNHPDNAFTLQNIGLVYQDIIKYEKKFRLFIKSFRKYDYTVIIKYK